MGRVVPVYPLTEGLFQRPLRSLLHRLVEAHAGETPDILPDELRRRRNLLPAAAAYRSVHFPEQLDDVEAARRRFAFEDFFVLQVGLTLRRRRQAREPGRALAPPGALVAQLLRQLPFALTPAQERVWSEIRSDLARPVPMNRLLQGDVGSGKTIVARDGASDRGGERDTRRCSWPRPRSSPSSTSGRSGVSSSRSGSRSRGSPPASAPGSARPHWQPSGAARPPSASGRTR